MDVLRWGERASSQKAPRRVVIGLGWDFYFYLLILGRKKHQFVAPHTYAFIGCLCPDPGQSRGDPTCNLWGQRSNQLNYPARGRLGFQRKVEVQLTKQRLPARREHLVQTGKDPVH